MGSADRWKTVDPELINEHYIKEGDSSSCSWRKIVQNNLSRVTHRTSNLPILPPADPIHFKDIYSETFDPGGYSHCGLTGGSSQG